MRAPAAVAALVVAGCAAKLPPPAPFPEACPVCKQPIEDPETFTSDGLLGVRWGELSPRAETHMTLTQGQPHLRSGFGLEFAAALSRDDRYRFFVFHDWTVGAWGDQQHGEVMWENGGGLKATFLGDLTLYELYALVSDSLLAGFGGVTGGSSVALGNVLGGGLGARLFRAFAVEVTGHWLYSTGAPFIAPDLTSSAGRSVGDISLSLLFDTCSFGWCNRGARRQESKDVTCAIYTDARDLVCKAAKKEGGDARDRLCQHAREAMALSDTEGPALARDAVARFLGDLATRENGAPHAAAELTLANTNDCLAQWRSCGRKQECLLDQKGETIKTRRLYAPYVVELLAALGCDADGHATPDCNYVCEDPAAKPDICR